MIFKQGSDGAIYCKRRIPKARDPSAGQEPGSFALKHGSGNLDVCTNSEMNDDGTMRPIEALKLHGSSVMFPEQRRELASAAPLSGWHTSVMFPAQPGESRGIIVRIECRAKIERRLSSLSPIRNYEHRHLECVK